jgi:hypothetical protein
MTLLLQFGGKIYNINYHGTPEAYSTFLPTAQQIIEFFTVTEMSTGNQTNSNMTNG